jgi:hypothetical protein
MLHQTVQYPAFDIYVCNADQGLDSSFASRAGNLRSFLIRNLNSRCL